MCPCLRERVRAQHQADLVTCGPLILDSMLGSIRSPVQTRVEHIFLGWSSKVFWRARMFYLDEPDGTDGGIPLLGIA